ncbi:Acetyltransferase AlgX (SGNH hydrolase-like protein) [Hyphomicrobiales bacterium]|nr:Acetyltransferase AlgX (SGNH hydrolase-like protein) [Hyphomicrobiales bacterium]CAH1675460.1 Acetyltransferase AlgX (SGNH hydrolase-like protein) [Hyphomicrobiales bacterium]
MKSMARHWFLIAVALVMLAPAAAMVARAIPLKGPQRFSVAKLAGATPELPPIEPSLAALRSGALQTSVAAALTERMGQPRETFIRINNGMAYALGRSTVPSIVIGQNRMLYETTYIDDWCGRGTPIDAEGQAARIARIAATVERAGKAFVFIISPSKVALYPDSLPEPCTPAASRDYNRLRAALAPYDVRVVDGHTLAQAAKASQDLPVFNRDGIHWNDLSVYPAIRDTFAVLGEQLDTPPRQLTLSRVEVDRWPFDDEDDLARLLNLPVTLPVYPSPHGRFTTSAEGTPPRLLVVGSSFMWQFLRILSMNRALGDSKFYFYFSRIVDFRDGGVHESRVPFQAAPDLPRSLPKTDAVVLEANETALGSPHIEAFENALASLTGKGTNGRLPDP